MNAFGPAAVLGLCFGMMFGFGCSLAVLYSIYLGGYRKGVGDTHTLERTTAKYLWRHGNLLAVPLPHSERIQQNVA